MKPTTKTARWDQQPRFVELLDAWCQLPGNSIPLFAKSVGRSENSIYSYRSRKQAKPPFELAQKFAEVLGCSVTELLPLSELTLGTVAEGLSEREQYLLEIAVRKFKDPALEIVDREMLLEDWTRDFDRLLAAKTRNRATS